MTAAVIVLSLVVLGQAAALVVWQHRVDEDRRAERAQYVAALLSRSAGEFAMAQRAVDPHLIAEGIKSRRSRRDQRRRGVEDDEPQTPVGLGG